MNQFACGDIVPGCCRVFLGSENQILEDVVVPSWADHHLSSIPDSLIAAIRGNTKVPA